MKRPDENDPYAEAKEHHRRAMAITQFAINLGRAMLFIGLVALFALESGHPIAAMIFALIASSGFATMMVGILFQKDEEGPW